MLSIWANWWEYWNLYHKVTFDGENKVIIVNSGERTIDVKTDIYDAWLEWKVLFNNSSFDDAMRIVGGDALSPTESLDYTVFLLNGWRVRPPEEDCVITLNGNLFVDGGNDDPFTTTIGDYTASFLLERSAIIHTVHVAGEVWDEPVEGTYTAKEVMRIMASALAGKVSGGQGFNIKFRDLNDTVDRIDAIVDVNSNRLSVTLNED